MKNLFLSGFVIFIIPMTLYAANQDGTTIDKTHARIKKNPLRMDKLKCIADYKEQRKNFLRRKYINERASEPFDEIWRYKTNLREKSKDMAATDKAKDLLKPHFAIRACADGSTQQYHEKFQLVLRNRLLRAMKDAKEQKNLLRMDGLKCIANYNDKKNTTSNERAFAHAKGIGLAGVVDARAFLGGGSSKKMSNGDNYSVIACLKIGIKK